MLYFCSYLLLSYDWEDLFVDIFLVDRRHFYIVFLFHLRSHKGPIDFKFYGIIFRYLLHYFDRYWQCAERLDEAITWIHGDIVFFIGFDLKNKIVLWDICNIQGLIDIKRQWTICKVGINSKKISHVHALELNDWISILFRFFFLFQ